MSLSELETMRDPDAALAEHAPSPWRICWSAVWVGALAAICVALIFGLCGTAVGAHKLGPGRGLVRWKELGVLGAIFGIGGAFFSFVVGGWIAGTIGRFRRSEPAMLHGAMTWLVAVPLLVGLAALGSGGLFGTWYGGLAGTPPWQAPANAVTDPQVALSARNAASAAVVSLLIGVVGAVIGGWMASGEPMTFTYYRTRARAHGAGPTFAPPRGRV